MTKICPLLLLSTTPAIVINFNTFYFSKCGLEQVKVSSCAVHASMCVNPVVCVSVHVDFIHRHKETYVCDMHLVPGVVLLFVVTCRRQVLVRWILM